MPDRIWILGAADPEMQAIESLLRECGETVVYATIDGRRVSGGEAYRAECPAELQGGNGESLTKVCRVECAWDHSYESLQCIVATIDHHRPGDPGFGEPPEEFLRASSLGQVIAELSRLGALPSTWDDVTTANCDARAGDIVRSVLGGWGVIPVDWSLGASASVPANLVIIAAADHCLGAAYAGKCPGVDPDELMRWRAESRAKFQGRDVDALLADVATAKATLESAQKLALSHSPGNHCGGSQCGCREGGYGYGGSTRVGTGDCYCECDGCHDGDHVVLVSDMRGVHVPELPEAGTRYGIPYVADGLPGPDGRVKIVCSGSAEVVRAFFGWAAREGLVDAYGDPERGFAGAYRAI